MAQMVVNEAGSFTCCCRYLIRDPTGKLRADSETRDDLVGYSYSRSNRHRVHLSSETKRDDLHANFPDFLYFLGI
jgi:hypothetical protein